jgi:flagellar motor switch protein FliN/FliY
MAPPSDELKLTEFEPNAPLATDAVVDGYDKSAADLAPVFDVPVSISAELDRKIGEAIDIYVNNRLVARGEVVVVDERLGVTMTEIIKDGDSAP